LQNRPLCGFALPLASRSICIWRSLGEAEVARRLSGGGGFLAEEARVRKKAKEGEPFIILICRGRGRSRSRSRKADYYIIRDDRQAEGPSMKTHSETSWNA